MTTEDPTEEKDNTIEITKVSDKDGAEVALGEEITYTITVENKGNVTVSDIEVKDDLTGDSWTIKTLAPEGKEGFTTKWTVTEEDIIAGKVVNSATAKGTDPEGDPTEDDVTTEDPTEDPNGHLTITKDTTSKPKNGDVYKYGETIEYEITVTNDGNLTITQIKVTDEKTGDEWTIASLAPGASETFTASYTVQLEDVKAGKVVNVATGTGTSPDPEEPDVPVEPGEKEDPVDPSTEIIIEEPVGLGFGLGLNVGESIE